MTSRGQQVVYFPLVENRKQLNDILSRAAWFLTFSGIERISILLANHALAEAKWKLAPGMDPAIIARFDALRKLVRFVAVSSLDDIAGPMEEASTVLRWKEHASSPLVPPEKLKEWLAGRDMWRVDPVAVRQEGSFYINVSAKAAPDRAKVIEASRQRLLDLSERLGRRERAYVLATGPSVGDYKKYDYDDAVSIVCNSVILDDALMRRVRPEMLVFADPIFHFGPSEYAASFRASLRRAAAEFDFTICIPLKYQPVFRAAVPELEERTIAIPFVKDREFNFDLTKEFELKTTANVLTFVMVPLATTFSDRVGILGCDGRPRDQDDYFWSHNRATQINDKMANIREVHPGFFDIDYNDYYTEHCELLAEQFEAGEARGLRFESLGFSHVPALRQRSTSADHPAVPGKPEPRADKGPEERSREYPRLLVIDPVGVAERAATGRIKSNLLRGWPDHAFLQISRPHGDHRPSVLIRSPQAPSEDSAEISPDRFLDDDLVMEEIAAFDPQVIYYRPTIDGSPRLHALATRILDHHRVPLVTHLMDDWPSRLEAEDPRRWVIVDRALRDVLERSATALTISSRMSKVFQRRYGVDFQEIANGVDVEVFSAAAADGAALRAGRDEIVLRYCGALARDMTFAAMVDVARAVDAVADELPVRLEVYTMKNWRASFGAAVEGLRGTSVLETVSDVEYPALLAEADALVLAYNFDPDSLRYIRLSMPNKLPEYLASGSPVLAVGPETAAAINLINSNQLGYCVTEDDSDELVAAVRRLSTDSELRRELAERAQRWAFAHRDIGAIATRFQTILEDAAEAEVKIETLSSYTREARAHLDETDAVAELLISGNKPDPDRVMIDVGAHHGSALAPFARAGWTVYAFEPDQANRERLRKRFGDKDNVGIDPRAVSDSPAKEAAFYSSEESTGISALHAFRDTHQESDTVEVTTVGALVDTKELTRVDFLKIDVEGFDLSVLKGVPWERIKPDVIETEFEDAKTVRLGHTYRDLADFLVGQGYAVYLSEWHPIIRYGISHQWRRLTKYPDALASSEGWGNVLAFLEDPGIDTVRSAFLDCLEVEDPTATEGETVPAGEPVVAETPPADVPASTPALDPPAPAVAEAAHAATRQGRPQSTARAGLIMLGSLALAAGLVAAGVLVGGIGLLLAGAGALALAGGLLWSRRTLQGGRSSASGLPRYERARLWASRRPRVFAAGRVLARIGRTLKARPLLTLAAGLAIAAPLATGLAVGGEAGTWLLIGAGAAAALAVLGAALAFVLTRIRRSIRELRSQHANTRHQLARAQNRQEAMRKRLSTAEARIQNVRDRIGQSSTSFASRHDQTQQTVDALAGDIAGLAETVGELDRAQATRAAQLDALADTDGVLKARLDELEDEHRAAGQALKSAVNELESELHTARDGVAAQIEQLAAEQLATRASLEEKIAGHKTSLGALNELSSALEALGQDVSSRLADVEGQPPVQEALAARIEELAEEQRSARDATESRVGESIAAGEALGQSLNELRAEVSALDDKQHNAEELAARIEELAEEQRSARDATESRVGESIAAGEALGQSLNELRAEVSALDDKQHNAEELAARIEELAEAQRSASDTVESFDRDIVPKLAALDKLNQTRDALESGIEEFESTRARIDAEVDGLRVELQQLSQSSRASLRDRERHLSSRISLGVARVEAQLAEFDGVVLLIAPERSGSTWLFDLLRSHPAAIMYPTADLSRRLRARGRRYPLHLSGGPDSRMEIEVQDGIGAAIPEFIVPGTRAAADQRLAIEKVHPSAIRFDAGRFAERVEALDDSGTSVYPIYLCREPIDSLRSFLAYREREPGWHSDAPEASEYDLYLRSYETMLELASTLPGRIVTYEQLHQDPVETVTALYEWLWPDHGQLRHVKIATRAIELTSPGQRKLQQTGAFLADNTAKASRSDMSLLLGANGGEGHRGIVDRTRELYETLSELGGRSDKGAAGESRKASTATRAKRSRRSSAKS